jgi:hypothetical protein
MSNRVIKNTGGDPSDNRRKAKRRPILETFSLFLVVAKKSVCQLRIHDLSELGIGFDIDVEGETAAEFPVATGEALEVELYLNQSLHFPLQVKVMRVEDTGKNRKIGGEYTDKKSPGYLALLAFLEMLDRVTDVAQIDKNPKSA